jgi:dihydrofolate synthase/folylpolyglutamate synthase
LAALGDPHRDYPTVHLTGTNGKGTTTTLVSALLTATGLRVGTFTSPDLHAVNERIALAGQSIADDELRGLLSRMADVEQATGIALTRFEILTVAALLHFSDEGVDVGVIEVGLGGTWDSTNVIDSSVAVITNVDLDHTAVLGDTVFAIASDKVGIFRADGLAIVGTYDSVVRDVAMSRCAQLGTTLWMVGNEFELIRNDVAVGGRLLSIRTPFATYEDVLLSLHGIHQGDNATTALAATEAFLDRALGDEIVNEVFSSFKMPGRLELLTRHPMIVVDGAHNPAGVRALAATLEGAFYVEGERRCVLGMLNGRVVDDMVRPLVEAGFLEFHVCAPSSPRAMPTEDVAAAVRKYGGVAIEHRSSLAALAYAREHSGDDDLIVVAGSLYLVAEVRGAILKIADRRT